MSWDFSCKDWAQRLEKGKSLVPKLPLDKEAARRAVGIFNKLRLPDVVGQPAMATAAGDWQRDIVSVVFGSLIEGIRRVPEVGALVPKKNSKTTGGAGIMLTALLMNKRPRAEFILVGPTQEVADLAFQQAAGMIDADPEGYLQKRFLVQEHIKTIYDRVMKAKLKIKTFDLKVMTGAKPAGVLVDELHLMSNMSFASRVIGQIRGGLIANPEAFLIFITTQSDAPPAGAFKTELKYWRDTRDGKIKETRALPILYEFPEVIQRSDAWQDPKIWPQVLPNLGLSITLDRLKSDWAAAQDKGEEEVRRWASQHLNIEIGLALHSDSWIGARYWASAADPEPITIESMKRRCDVVTVGIDGGGLDDLSGMCVLGREKTTRDWLCWNKAWVHEEALEKRKEIAERLRDFERDGDLVICTYPTQDAVEIAEICLELKESGLLPEKTAIGLDPLCIGALLEELGRRGMVPDPEGGPLVSVRQGIYLSPASWGLERKLKDGTFWHQGSAMMAWCVGNAKTEQKGNAVLISKETAGKAKIDPFVATLNATMLMNRAPEVVIADVRAMIG